MYSSLQIPIIVVCVFGLVGNVITILVLIRHRPQTSYSFLLRMLAVADAGFIISKLCFSSDVLVNWCSSPYCTYPLEFVNINFVYFSNWTIVILSADRYQMICRPLHARRLCTISRGKKAILIVAILSSLMTGIEYVIRLWLLPYYSYRMKFLTDINLIFPITSRYVPFITVLVINLLIVTELIRASRIHTRLTVSQVTRPNQSRGLIINLLVTVAVYMACTLPGLIGKLVLWFEIQSYITLIFYLSLSDELLIVINSSVNYIIYFICFKNFRDTTILLLKNCYRK